MSIPTLNKFKIQLPPITEKNSSYIVGGIFLAILMADYFLIMQWQFRALMKLNPKITVLSGDLKQTKNNMGRIDQYREEAARLTGKMGTIGNRILLKEEIPMILDNISRMANEAGVRINQIMPLKDSQELVLTNDDGKYFAIPILVNARGGYHGIGRFFNMVESGKIFMNIADFDIAATSDDPAHHAAKITIKTFFLEKPEVKENNK